MEYRSYFGYGLSRPFPWRWYTPATVTLFIVSLIITTFLNLATTGFSMIPVKSSDLRHPLEINGTRAQHNLLMLGYFLNPNLKPSCQPVSINVGDKISSPYYGLFSFSLTRIRILDPDTGKNRTDSAFRYFFNPIKSCKATSGVIEIEGPGQTAQQMSWNAWNPTLRYSFECVIEVAMEPPFAVDSDLQNTINYLDLTADYTYLPPNVPLSNGSFTDRMLYRLPIEGIEEKPVLAWAESLLTMYWARMSLKLAELNQQFKDAGMAMNKGAISFRRNSELDDAGLDNYYAYRYQFRSATGDLLASSANKSLVVPLLDKGQEPNIWETVDRLAKTIRNVVLYDLHWKFDHNILLNYTMMEQYTQNFTHFMDELSNKSISASVRTRPWPYTTPFKRPAGETSDLDRAMLKKLQGKPPFLDVNFNCDMAMMKPVLEIVLEVAVQNVVLLGTIYGLWTWLICNYVLTKHERKDEIAYCEGCLKKQRNARDDDRTEASQEDEDSNRSEGQTK